jgi:hypothetical protein
MADKKIPPIQNPELDNVIASLKEGSTTEKQIQLSEVLKKARLLSPCDFDVKFKQEENGTIQTANPSQIKFYLINTNDGKTFFPVFTNIENSKLVNFGKDIHPKQVVRQVKDYDPLLNAPNTKAIGLIINPGKDNIVIPKNMVSVIAGNKKLPIRPTVPPTIAPLNVQYGEPTVYPTKMAMAIYDRAEETKEINRVWLKQKVVGHSGSFYIVVESSSEEEHVLNEIREVAVPNAKNVPVEVVFANESIMKNVVKETTALFDRNLEL